MTELLKDDIIRFTFAHERIVDGGAGVVVGIVVVVVVVTAVVVGAGASSSIVRNVFLPVVPATTETVTVTAITTATIKMGINN